LHNFSRFGKTAEAEADMTYSKFWLPKKPELNKWQHHKNEEQTTLRNP